MSSFLSRFQKKDSEAAMAISPLVGADVLDNLDAKPTDWLEGEAAAFIEGGEVVPETEVVQEIEIHLPSSYSLDDILAKCVEIGGSDLHFTTGSPPTYRINGLLYRSKSPPISAELADKLLLPLANAHQLQHFQTSGNLDMAYELPNVARFRCNFFTQHHGMGAVFRVIPSKMPTMDQLELPKVMRIITQFTSGLVIVTGPTGSGKSTTLASIISEINHTRPSHIITIEDPIEFYHSSDVALIDHREVGTHAISFADALRAAMREDPDILLVGEMRDLDTIYNAIKAAEMGCLIFATLHTNSAPKTINRIVDVFPARQQEQVRSMLADSLKTIVAQQLLRRKDGSGRVAAHEVMMGGAGVGNLIRKGDMSQLQVHLHNARGEGNRTMDFALAELVRRGTITKQAAIERSQDPAELIKVIRSQDQDNNKD